MMEVQSYIVLLLAQVTVIGVVALTMSHLARRNAANRHTIALTGLILLLLSPLTTWLLPSHWHISDSTPSSSSPVVADRSALEHEADFQQSSVNNLSSPSFARDVTTEPCAGDVSAQPLPPTIVQAESTVIEASEFASLPQEQTFQNDPTVVAAPSAPTAKPQSWFGAAFVAFLCIWCTGTIVYTARLMIRLRRFHSLVLPLRPLTKESLPANVRQSLQKALGTTELPEISTSSTVPTPVVIGVLRPIVVLPEAIINELAEEELTSVLIHECAHVVRRDPWIHLAQQFASIVWWFHPIVNKLSHVLSRSREEICDNYVLRHSGPAEFARTLLKLAERCPTVRPALSLLGMFGSLWSLETRVQELLAPQRNMFVKSKFRRTAAIAIALSACSAIVGGRSMQAGEPLAVSKQNSAEVVQQVAPEESTQADTQTQTDTQTSSNGTIKVSLSGLYHLPESNDPVLAKVQVYHLRLGDLHLLSEMQTDEKGEFEFKELELEKQIKYENIILLATAPGFVSSSFPLTCWENEHNFKGLKLPMANNPSTISGTVTDEDGSSVVGANVFLPDYTGNPIPGFRSAVTDSSGRFKISDLPAELYQTLTEDLEPTQQFVSSNGFNVMVRHPDYPNFRARYAKPRKVVDIQLPPPAVVEGRVLDLITGNPVPNVAVHAQGIARSDWGEVRTDSKGHFHLRLGHDHYNIWAVQDGRMPLAIKALEAVPGVRSVGHEIRMVRGGFINGRVLSKDREPMAKGLVGHHGPARPATGAAVTSAKINEDGTFRLQVAPGRNYVYLMSNQSANAYVDVGEGQEVDVELVVDDGSVRNFESDPDRMLAAKLLFEKRHRREQPKQSRIRNNTPTGRLLNQLENMHQSNELRYSEPWAGVLREIIQMGPDAVPELIEELDATDNQAMLRCLGFMLRAIDDKRAVPALIRAIPKTLQPASSDYGRRIDNDKELLKFMQKHDLDEDRRQNSYDFGRPVREIFGALESLTGQTFNEQQLFGIFRNGSPAQIIAKEKLFYQTASHWRDWWEQTGAAMVDEPKYKKVGLARLPESKPTQLGFAEALKTGVGSTGSILESIRATQAKNGMGQFYDLDTGRSAGLPEKWKGQSLTDSEMDAVLKWASDEGFDIMGDEYPNKDGSKTYALRTIGLQAWQLNDSRWKSMPKEFSVNSLKAEGDQIPDEWLLFRDQETQAIEPQKRAPFVFVTREGTPGVIYVGVPVTKDPDITFNFGVARDPDLTSTSFLSGRRFGIETLLPK